MKRFFALAMIAAMATMALPTVANATERIDPGRPSMTALSEKNLDFVATDVRAGLGDRPADGFSASSPAGYVKNSTMGAMSATAII